MRRIIITNGTGGAGKDTFCEYVTDYLGKKGYTAWRSSYVEFTRFMLSENGIDTSKKTDKDRVLLAELNRLLEEYDDIPFKDCCQLIDDALFKSENNDPYQYCPEDLADVILLDVRNPDVIEKFKTVYNNVITVLIDNGTTNTATEEDRGVFNYRYDRIISNTRDLDFLKQQAEVFADEIIGLKECEKRVTDG